jgi:hypothetical protein
LLWDFRRQEYFLKKTKVLNTMKGGPTDSVCPYLKICMFSRQAWWCMPVIHHLRSSGRTTASLMPAWATEWYPASNNNNNIKN